MSDSAPNEEELQKLQSRYAEGDLEALNCLSAIYHDALVDLLLRKMRLRLEDAEDLAMTTWHRVRVKHDRYDPCRPFFPWLRTVARRLAVDHFRRKPRDTKALAEDLPDPAAAPLDDLIRREQEAQLDDRIKRLPPAEQQAILGRRAGLKNEEIAKVLGKSRGRAAQLVHRALRKLQAGLTIENET